MKTVMILRAALLGSLLAIAALALTWGLGVPAAAAPTPGSSTIIGTVIDERNALPIKDASILVLQGASVVASGTTDAFGDFTISNVPGGVYDISIRAKGYGPSSTLNVSLASSTTITVNATLREATAISGVRTIGTVAVSASALASATTITQPVNIQAVASTGQVRFADQLTTLPAINLHTSSSPGDDVSIDMRGFGSSETATLLDGRPVGGLGVLAPDSFNFADTPIVALEGVDVTYGSGAQGLYGSDTIAGAVNMHLLNPTATPQYMFEQQVGGDGILTSAFNTTGTAGKLGYAVVAGVSGFHGALNGQVFQSARPGLIQSGSVSPPFVCSNQDPNVPFPDVSACNQAAETYAVTQDSKLTTEMAKMKYAFTTNTSLSISAYSAVQWADSTGNGDNDYLPYATRLAQVQRATPDCIIGSGATDNGYTVMTNPATDQTACYSPQQWAAASYGPDGGGIGRNRSANMRDFDAHFASKFGSNNIAIDGYIDNFDYYKDSSSSGGLDPNGAKLGTPDFTDFFYTHGLLISDDFLGNNNDLGLGFALLNQLQLGTQLVSVGSNPSTGESMFAFAPHFSTGTFREDSFFVRDSHEFNDRFSGFFNAWVKRSNVTGKTTFDPRVSAQFRPDSSDVIRLTFGHSDGPPAPELKSTGLLFEQDPGASLTNVSCVPGSNALPAGGGNPNLTSESANDVELGYGHRFQGDSNIQINAYVTPVTNELFAATEPLLQYGLNHVTFASTTLSDYLNHLKLAGCLPAGATIADTYPFLGISTTYNLADELAKGVDVNGRYRFMPKAYIDYGYSIESSEQFNIPDTVANPILQSNPTLINGAQQANIPVHQGSVSLDVQPGAFEVRIDNYYIGKYNQLDRPAYWFSNGSISHPLDNGQYVLTLGGTNIFNQNVQYFGLLGFGQPVATNQFFPGGGSLSGIQQYVTGVNGGNEEFGLQPATLTFTVTARI
jgi:hypothetical protein